MLGGIGVALASSLGREKSANAADGDPLLLGQPNEASTRTILTGTFDSADSSLEVITLGLSGTGIHARAVGIGVRAEGITGVVGSSNSPNGSGVLGEDSTFDTVGRGVEGISHNGWGVYAVSGGQALRVDGRATFSRSGTAVIAASATSIIVPVPGILSQSSTFPERPSFALATLQTDAPDVWVRAAVLDYAAGTLTIHLQRARGPKKDQSSVTVGWMIVN